jgi:hypothetical protein
MPDLNEARIQPHSVPRRPPEIHELVDGTSMDGTVETARRLDCPSEGGTVVTGEGVRTSLA